MQVQRVAVRSADEAKAEADALRRVDEKRTVQIAELSATLEQVRVGMRTGIRSATPEQLRSLTRAWPRVIY